MSESMPENISNNTKEKIELPPEELEKFRKELQSIFNDRFFTLGHGTRLEVAETILKEGLQAKADHVASTVLPLENTDDGLSRILNWQHHNLKTIIVIMVPRIGITHESQIWEELRGQDGQFENKYILPSKFIKGYIDVNSRKLILNDKFEENPKLKDPIISPPPTFGGNKKKGKIDIPGPSDQDNKGEVW